MRLQQLHVEVSARADAERAVVELGRLLLRVLDQVLHARDRQRGMRDQRVIDGDEPAHRHEILDRVIGQLGVEARVDDERDLRADQQRVAVGRRLGDVFGRDLVVGARPVLDDRLLAEALREALRELAPERIGDAAGRGRHHDGDGPRRKGLRVRERRKAREREQRSEPFRHCSLPDQRHFFLASAYG
jgi:hypothetical protein